MKLREYFLYTQKKKIIQIQFRFSLENLREQDEFVLSGMFPGHAGTITSNVLVSYHKITVRCIQY